MSHLLSIFKALQVLFPVPDRADRWLRNPHRFFGGRSALDVILGGKLEDIVRVATMWTPRAEADLPYPICDIDGDFHRLIPSRFPPVPLYERIGSRTVQAAVEACEAKTNPRLHALERLAQEGDRQSEQRRGA